MRRRIVPIANIGSKVSMPVILPIKFDASRRACTILKNSNRFAQMEVDGLKKVLTAALTYLYSALNSILQLLRLLGMARGR